MAYDDETIYSKRLLTGDKTGEEYFLFLLSSQCFKQRLWSLPLSSIILKKTSVNISLKIIQLHKFLKEIWYFKTMKTHHCLFKALLLLLSSFSRVRLCATPETAAHQAPPSLGFSRQEHQRGYLRHSVL